MQPAQSHPLRVRASLPPTSVYLHYLVLGALAIIMCLSASGQNIGMNATGAAPDASAMLDISSTTSGLLTPRMTSSQRNAITAPATGLLVYDLSSLSFWQYDGTQWVEILSGSDNDWTRVGGTIFNANDSIAIGRSVPYTDLHVAAGKNVLFGDSLSGSGFKFIYYSQKGAVRFGFLTNPFGGYNYNRFWDYDSVGYYSFAGGQNSRAKGFGAFAFGSFGWADGSGSVAFFGNAKGNNSFTFGGSSKGRGSITFEGVADDEGGIAMYGYTGGRYGVSIGGGTTGLGASSSRADYAVAIGWNSDARGQASIALGPSDAYGYNSFSTGWVTEARGNYSSTFGYRTNSYAYASMALGRYNLVQGDSALWISSDPIFQIGDGTSNTNRSNSFTVLKNGQTAVGLNYPTGMLHVSAALGSLGNTVNTSDASVLIGSTSAGLAFDANQIESIGDELHLNYGSSENIRMAEGGGNVGIGDLDPNAKLVVRDEGAANTQTIVAILESNTSNRPTLLFDETAANTISSGMSIEYDGTANELHFNAVGGSPRMTVESGGKVGIGTEAPSDYLQVDAPSGNDAMRVRVGGTTRLRVHDNGGVSIGANVNPPTSGLYVLGQSRYDGNVLPDNNGLYSLGQVGLRWTTVYAINGTINTSDRREKENIKDLTYGLAEIQKLRPVSFSWKASEDGRTKLGLIAQELLDVVPEVVETGESADDRMGVYYSDLIPVLVKAIQELEERVSDQQLIIERLESTFVEN